MAGYTQLSEYAMKTVAAITFICGLCRLSHTAEVGDLRLADGPSPNMGRVLMYLGERGWFDTCDPQWGINNAIVVCRQLGFPGAAFARAHFGRANGVPLSRTVSCTGYESKLSECPYHTTPLCTAAVGVVCQEPSYMGCYADEPSDSMFHDGHSISHFMDISECEAFCRTKMARFMGLKNKQECYCGKTGRALPTHEKLKDSECQMSCVGNKDEICGGVSVHGHYVLSVHKMNVRKCKTLFNPANGYLLDTAFTYGDVVRFECDPGYELVGSKSVQCILQSQARRNVVWNASTPVCTLKDNLPVAGGKVWLPPKGTTGKLLVDKPGLVLVIAIIVVLALLAPVCVIALIRTHLSKRKTYVDDGTEKHSYEDLVYNTSYEPNPAPYEPLRPPRKRDALRAQNSRTLNPTSDLPQQGGIDIDNRIYAMTLR